MLNVTYGKRKIGKGLIDLLLFIYAVLIAINGVYSVSVKGIPLFSLYFLCFSGFISLFFVVSMKTKTDCFPNRWLFVGVIFICFFTSVLQGWNLISSLYNAFLYGTPFLLVALPSYRKININFVIFLVRVMVVIGAAITLLVYFGVIDAKISNENLRLNIKVLDNSISLLGIIVSLYQIFDNSMVKKRWAPFFLVLSYLIAFFGQSRARIILSVAITTIFILHALLKNKKKRVKIILLVLVVFTIVVLVVNAYYDAVMAYINLTIDKFGTIMGDESSEYRIKEIKIHIDLLKEHPLMGIGSGALNHEYRTSIDKYFLGHCMLTSFWALNGMFVGSFMLFSLISLVIKSFTMAMRKSTLKNVMALTLAGTLLFLSASSAGFAKYSTHIMMLLLGCCFAEDYNEDEEQS